MPENGDRKPDGRDRGLGIGKRGKAAQEGGDLINEWWKAWISAGQDPAAFWAFTIAECDLIIRAAIDRTNSEFERQRVVAHELAGLVAYAFHQPKDMPEYEPATKKPQPLAQPTALDDAKIRGFFIYQSMRPSQ